MIHFNAEADCIEVILCSNLAIWKKKEEKKKENDKNFFFFFKIQIDRTHSSLPFEELPPSISPRSSISSHFRS